MGASPASGSARFRPAREDARALCLPEESMPYRAVFFDLGGTLFAYSSGHAYVDTLLQGMAARRGIAKSLSELRRRYRSVLSRVMASYVERSFYLHRDLFAEAHAAFFESIGVVPEPDATDVAEAGRRLLGEASVTPRAEGVETLIALRQRGFALSLVSNIDDDQFQLLWPRLGLDAYFDHITTSEEARSCKPDARIFHLALEKAGDPEPESVLFVGDSVDHDVVGANAVGMTSVLIGRLVEDPSPHRTPRHVISDLREIVELVDRAAEDDQRVLERRRPGRLGAFRQGAGQQTGEHGEDQRRRPAEQCQAKAEDRNLPGEEPV